MGKQPYIPLYIGDWEKDTNTISLEAEAALLKLVFKLWDSKDRGQLSISLNQLSILLKKGQEMSLKILTELHENSVLDIEFLENDALKIKSRRMLKDLEKSRVASEKGKKGGRPKKANRKLNESQPKANSDIDSVIVNGIKKRKGAPKFDLILPYGSIEFLTLWNHWIEYRAEAKKPYHTLSNQQAALQRLQLLAGPDEDKAIAIIKQSLERNWINFFDITEHGKQTRPGSAPDADELFKDALRNSRSRQSGNNATGSTG